MIINERLKTKKKAGKKGKKKNKFDITKLKVKRRGSFTTPTLTYAGKPLRVKTTAARHIFVHKGAVIKVEDSGERWQTQGEIEFFDQLKKKDSKYFPKLIAADLKRGIVVQSFEHLDDPLGRPRSARKKVKELQKKYRIGDIDPKSNYNWAMRHGTKDPIIYDIGAFDIDGASSLVIRS